MDNRISRFLAGSKYAVVGASTDQSKYGNKVLRCYKQAGREVVPVNPKAINVEGILTSPSIDGLPDDIPGVSVATPPQLALDAVTASARRGIRHIWFQPGAESAEAVSLAEALGMNCVFGGPCLLVALKYRE